MRQSRVQDSLQQAEEAVRLRPDSAEAQNNFALALFRSGRLNEAAQHWQSALQLAPDDVNAECNYAWLLATAPIASLRNGERAVTLTQDVLKRNGRDNAAVLRAAGAALAEAGRFSEAISAAEEALRVAKQQQNSALVQDLELNLANYRARRPLRDPGKF